jgi:hypothetical protein
MDWKKSKVEGKILFFVWKHLVIWFPPYTDEDSPCPICYEPGFSDIRRKAV